MNDYIEIDNLVVFANHGVFDEEETMGQRFMISLKLYTDVAIPARNDDISKSINYGEVCQFVTQFTQNNRSKLIETAAENIAYALLLKYETLNAVEVKLKKPWAPIGLPLDNVLVSIMRRRSRAFVSLGSNIGDKKGYLDFALKEIDSHRLCRVVKVSDYIETKPVGNTEQDDFLNACAEVETFLPPYELLHLLNSIEALAGRVRDVHWGPRTLDIDIVLFDDITMTDEALTIPHREMHKRLFVLRPLCQIAPYAYHPVKHTFVSELKDELEAMEAKNNGNPRLL